MNQPRVNRQISDADKTTKVPDNSPFYFKMVKELIWCILRESNVKSSNNTLSFYLKKVLEIINIYITQRALVLEEIMCLKIYFQYI